MVLCITTLLIDVLENKDAKQLGISIVKYILMGIIGIVLFYVLSYIALWVKKLPISNYSGTNSIGLMAIISNLRELIPESYQSFFNYYFNDKMLSNTIWHINILYIIIFVIELVSLVYIVIKNKIYKKVTRVIFILLLLAISPLCFGIIEIVAPDVDMHILMACSMIYIFPIFFKILELLPRNKISRAIKYVVVVCSLIIAWNYMWQDNASYIAIKSMQNQTVNTATRLVTHIEELDGYNPEMQVLILGGLENNSYLNRQNTLIETKKLYDRTWGFISSKPTVWWGNQDSWQKIFYEYVGVNLNLISERECSEVLETEEFKTMKHYPEKDGIKIINNVVVVKLSDW